MGLIYAEITLQNVKDLFSLELGRIKKEAVRSIKTRAMVDSGAAFLVIPDHIRIQLGLDVLEQREVEVADGRCHVCDVVGPLTIRFKNRRITMDAMVLGNEVLLGAIPMRALDVVIHPLREILDVNPENPFMPKMKVKHTRQPGGRSENSEYKKFQTVPDINEK